MILASSDAGDIVVDPFSGSGTTLRVCQQLDRHAIGIEINPDYVANTKVRLSQSFEGFDSIDPRMKRVPLDLRQTEIRAEYFENHKKWFLGHHENALTEFEKAVMSVYGQQDKESARQVSLFERTEQKASQPIISADAQKTMRR